MFHLRLLPPAAALGALVLPAPPPQGLGGGGELAPWLERLAPDGRRVRLEDVEGSTCLECHPQVAEEWRHSAHATAWQDEHYRRELRRVRQKRKCWGCHVPLPMVPAGLPQHPEARSEHRNLGVDCAACHLAADGRTVLGPLGLETEAHPTRRSEYFGPQRKDNALCTACHATSIGPVIGIAKDFVETRQAELDLSCVGCHMPALRGPTASAPPGEEERTYPVRERRSHRLMTPRDPEFLASAFRLTVRERDGLPVLVIENQAGHRVPGMTRRRLVFVARVIDEGGDVVAEVVQAFDHRSYLPVEESLELVLDETGTTLEVEARHELEGMGRPQTFLKRTFGL